MGPDQTRPTWLPVDQIYAPSYEGTHLGTAKSFNTVNMEPEDPVKNDAWCYEGTYLGKAKNFNIVNMGPEETIQSYASSYEGTHLGTAKNFNIVNPDTESPLTPPMLDWKFPERPTEQDPDIRATATYRVLNTIELLDNILINLDAVPLYLARQVCDTWRDLIDTSPTLRSILYSTAPPQVPLQPGHGYNYQSPQFTLNPIITHLNLICPPTPDPPCSSCNDDGSGFCYHPYHIARCHFPPRWRIEKGVAGWSEFQLCEPPIKQVFLISSWLEKYVVGKDGRGVTVGQIADYLELERVGKLCLWHR